MKANNTNLFEKIYEVESDSVFRFCLTRVSNKEQALDITQETFLRLWKNIMNGEDIINQRAFIFKIARNLIIDWYRKKKSLSLNAILESGEEGSMDVVDDKAMDSLHLGIEGRYLLTKISELPETLRGPIYLKFVEGFSPTEIGEVLKITANAASVRINRALALLREKTGYNIEKDEEENE